jgi:hypothetical protein
MHRNGDDGVQTLDIGSESIRITIRLPEDYTFLPDQHHFLNVGSSDESVISVPPFELPDMTFDWQVPVEVRGEGEAVLHLEGQVFFCHIAHRTVCIYATIDKEHRIRVVEGSVGRAELVHEIEVMDAMDGAQSLRVVVHPVHCADEK